MSTLIMALHGEKTLKIIIQKNLSNLRNLQGKCLWCNFVTTIRQTIFLQFTVTLLMILKLMILSCFIWKLHFQNPVEQLRWNLFVENLSTNCSSKKVWEAFHHWGYTRESWTPPLPPCLLILLIYTKYKNNKMNSWTHSTPSFPWVTPGTKI